jgi:hypothetical protein
VPIALATKRARIVLCALAVFPGRCSSLAARTAAALLVLTACDERRSASVDTPGAASAREARTAVAPDDAMAPAIPPETAAALEAIGYFPRAPADNPEDRGVVLETPSAFGGLAVYSSRDRDTATLTDTAGRVLHRWSGDREGSWMHVEPLPDGDLLAITKDRHLARRDWRSDVVWRARVRVHHDLALRDGHIYALVRRTETFTHHGVELPILADGVAILSADDGEVLDTIWLVPLLRASISRTRLSRIAARLDEVPNAELVRCGGLADVLHTNSIAFLHRDIPGIAPAGSVLISFRAISRVMIFDSDLERVLWEWGEGELEQQHDATQIANGNLLMFDNGVRRGRSRAIEVSPTTGTIVWAYERDDLFSRLRGGAQELPNGNVLITESDEGHALEVTRDGDLVWEFWNPDVRRGERAVIYRLNRYPPEYFEERLPM